MNAKERTRAMKLLDELRELLALDERRQATKGAHPTATPERMTELRAIAIANRKTAREAKLWAELETLQRERNDAELRGRPK